MSSHFSAPTYNEVDVPRNVLFGNKLHIDLNSVEHLGVWVLSVHQLLTHVMYQLPVHTGSLLKYGV